MDAPDWGKYSYSNLIALGGKKKILPFALQMIFINSQDSIWFLNILLLPVISYGQVF